MTCSLELEPQAGGMFFRFLVDRRFKYPFWVVVPGRWWVEGGAPITIEPSAGWHSTARMRLKHLGKGILVSLEVGRWVWSGVLPVADFVALALEAELCS
jgi:hypothetical protein